MACVFGPRAALATRRVPISQINWLGDGDIAADAPADGWDVEVRVRSTRPPKPAKLRAVGTGEDGRPLAEVILFDAEEGVAPGQACVFYAPDGDRVLGGGWITRS